MCPSDQSIDSLSTSGLSLSLCVFRVDYGSRLRVHFPYFSPTHTFLPPSPVLRHFLFHHTFSVSQSIWHTQHTLKVGGGGYIAWGVEKNIPSFFIRIFLVRIAPPNVLIYPSRKKEYFQSRVFSFFASLNRNLGWWYFKSKFCFTEKTPLSSPIRKQLLEPGAAARPWVVVMMKSTYTHCTYVKNSQKKKGQLCFGLDSGCIFRPVVDLFYFKGRTYTHDRHEREGPCCSRAPHPPGGGERKKEKEGWDVR